MENQNANQETNTEEITDNDINDLMEEISPKIKDVYFDVSTADEIYKAATESKIPTDLISDAAISIGDVLLGILDPKDLVVGLTNFGIPEVAATNFYRIISQSLFLKIKDELTEMYNPELASVEKPAIMSVSSPLPEPNPTQPEPSQQEGGITRIKIEAPPLRRVDVHHFEEEKEAVSKISPSTTETQSKTTQAQSIQPKINDPYREPVDNLVDLSGNTNS